MKTSLEDLITDGQIGAALILAREQFKDNSKFRQEIITLQSKYNTIEKQQRIGTISQDNANLEIAKIRWSLVQISEKKDDLSSDITTKQTLNFKQYLKYLILPVIIIISFLLWKTKQYHTMKFQ